MFSLKGNARSNSNSSDKQLKKLRRQDLLELLVEQLGENERLQRELSEAQSSVAALTDQVDRLKDKLDDKDVQIDHLKDKLDGKDGLLDRLKARLDEKDTVLADLFEGVKTMAEYEGSVPHESVVHLEEIAASYYLRQFAREAEEAEDETVAAEAEEAEEQADESAADEAAEAAEPEAEADIADEPEAAAAGEAVPEATEDTTVDEGEPEKDTESAADAEADDENEEAPAVADDASTENEANE